MRILLLSPYHGGSHQAWAEGYAAHSAHDVHLLTLPARFWKWRMEGGAITLARLAIQHVEAVHALPDLVLATDMVDLARFIALTRRQLAPRPFALYMHENQLTYPLPEDRATGPMRRQHGTLDRHLVMANVASMLAADHVYFNSDFHRRSFLDALPPFLRHYPEDNELEMLPVLAAKSSVLPVGIDFARLDPPLVPTRTGPPLVLWNQRWEYDKAPGRFLEALLTLADEGFEFEVALCGERFGLGDSETDVAIERLGNRVIANGFANDETYRRLLWGATLTFSTAAHEYFGISILEAIHCHTLPILPRRLSYPEIIPTEFHEACLVEEVQLLPRLRWALRHPQEAQALAQQMAAATADYAWPVMALRYDRELATLAAEHLSEPR